MILQVLLVIGFIDYLRQRVVCLVVPDRYLSSESFETVDSRP